MMVVPLKDNNESFHAFFLHFIDWFIVFKPDEDCSFVLMVLAADLILLIAVPALLVGGMTDIFGCRVVALVLALVAPDTSPSPLPVVPPPSTASRGLCFFCLSTL